MGLYYHLCASCGVLSRVIISLLISHAIIEEVSFFYWGLVILVLRKHLIMYGYKEGATSPAHLHRTISKLNYGEADGENIGR